MALQLIITKLQDKYDVSDDKLEELSKPILKEYIDINIKPLLNNIDVDKNIQIILNSKNDQHLLIDFDPTNSSQRDGAIVVCREFINNNDYIDHVYLNTSGKTHSQIQEEHPKELQHCRDSNGNLILCHAHYWYPIVFLSGYNTYPNKKEVATIIKNKYPDKIQKVYLYTGSPQKGGMIHKLARRLMKRII